MAEELAVDHSHLVLALVLALGRRDSAGCSWYGWITSEQLRNVGQKGHAFIGRYRTCSEKMISDSLVEVYGIKALLKCLFAITQEQEKKSAFNKDKAGILFLQL